VKKITPHTNRISQSRQKRKQQLNKNRFKEGLGMIIPKLPFLNRDNSLALRSQSNPNKEVQSPDKVLLFITGILMIFGWIMIYSGSFYVESQTKHTIFYDYNPFNNFILQGFWIIAGLIVSYIVYRIPHRFYIKFSLPVLVILIILLIVILLLPKSVNGAKLWLNVGNFTLQPAEFIKPALICYFAGLLAKKWNTKTTDQIKQYLFNRFIPFFLVFAVTIIFVFLGKDLGATALIAAISITMFFFCDNQAIHNFATSSLLVITIIVSAILAITERYRFQRLNTFINFIITGNIPDPLNTGFQLKQILIAVGTGGLFGSGFGQSKQKYFYLQRTAVTDTIFAVIAEEFGLFGSVILVLAYVTIFFRGLKIAQYSKTKSGSLMALGITVWISLQTIIHLGVNVGLVPLTGITLPFVSYGGSSLISTMVGMAMLLNLSKDVKVK